MWSSFKVTRSTTSARAHTQIPDQLPGSEYFMYTCPGGLNWGNSLRSKLHQHAVWLLFRTAEIERWYKYEIHRQEEYLNTFHRILEFSTLWIQHMLSRFLHETQYNTFNTFTPYTQQFLQYINSNITKLKIQIYYLLVHRGQFFKENEKSNFLANRS